MNNKKIDKLIWETYQILFNESTPKGDFDNLVKNATINKRGQKEIPFMDYEIEEKKYDNIIQKQIKKYNLKGYLIQQFKTTIALGCSPRVNYEKINK